MLSSTGNSQSQRPTQQRSPRGRNPHADRYQREESDKLGKELASKANVLAFNGQYDQAERDYKLVKILYAKIYGENDWRASTAELLSAFMKAASYPGCPRTIFMRLTQEFSSHLALQRQKYLHAQSHEKASIDLPQVLQVLVSSYKFWTSVLTKQRALELWTPILGPEHPKIVAMIEYIELGKRSSKVEPEPSVSQWDEAEVFEQALPQLPEFEHILSGTFPGNFMELCEDSATNLLQDFEALYDHDQNGTSLASTIRSDVKALRLGRTKAILGGYHSFLQKFDRAEEFFQESQRYMSYETCVEIKLHRLLWYAEHKTRVLDWNGVLLVSRQAHSVFMQQNSPSKFLVTHFPKRFELLCKAYFERVSIDKIVYEVHSNENTERHRSQSVPASIQRGTSIGPQSELDSPAQPADLLFPPTPQGFNSSIDVETWRKFVNYSPSTSNRSRSRSIIVAQASPNTTFLDTHGQ